MKPITHEQQRRAKAYADKEVPGGSFNYRPKLPEEKLDDLWMKKYMEHLKYPTLTDLLFDDTDYPHYNQSRTVKVRPVPKPRKR